MSAKKITSIVIAVMLVFIGIIGFFSSMQQVETGSVGIVKYFGEAQEEVLMPGLNFTKPFVTSVVDFDMTKKKLVVTFDASTKDLQTVGVQIDVEYQPIPTAAVQLYTDFRMEHEMVLPPKVEEAGKAKMAPYTAEELNANRTEVGQMIKESVSEKFNEMGLVVVDFNLTKINFSSQFKAAIDSKVEAEQNALKAEMELKQVTIEAQQRVAKAEADAEATKATADAEAYAIKAIQDQIASSPEYLEYIKWTKWNGAVPQVQGNSSTIVDLR